MKQKNFYTLLGIAVIALVGAFMLNRSKKPISNENSSATKNFLPELKDQVNAITSVILTGSENKVIATLKRSDAGWSVVEKYNYTADTQKLRELLMKLSDATILEAKTANKEKYADLGVDDIANKDAKGILITMEGLAKPVKVIIGNFNGTGGGGTFMRRADEPQSYLVRGNITIDKTTANWLKRDLTDIQATRFKEVALTNHDNKILKIYKENSGDANFKVADVPKGRELSSIAAADGIAAVFAGLRLDDVVPRKETDAEMNECLAKAFKCSFPPIRNAVYKTFDGLVMETQSWEKDGKGYLRPTASLDMTQAEASIKAAQEKAKAEYEAKVADANKDRKENKDDKSADASATATKPVEVPKPLAVSDPAKDREDQLAALNKEVTNLNQLFNNWTFVIPNFKSSSINKSMDDLLKPLEQPKPADIREAIKKKK